MLQQMMEWLAGDLDSSSKTQRISSPSKLAEHFKESLFFSGRSFSLPRIFLVVGKICKHSLFLKCSLYSALVCNNSSTADVFIFSLLTLAIPGTSPAQQLFVGGFFFSSPIILYLSFLFKASINLL